MGGSDWGQRSRDGAAAVVTDGLCVVVEWYPSQARTCRKEPETWS